MHGSLARGRAGDRDSGGYARVRRRETSPCQWRGPSCTAAMSAGACTIVFGPPEFAITAEYEGDAAFRQALDPKTHTVD